MTEKFAFPEVEIGQILEKVTNPVKVELNRKYVQIGIRSHGKGLFDKEEVTGEELGNKRVFWIEPDCFVVNIVFAWEQAVGRTTKDDIGKIASHRFPMYRPKNGKADIDFISYLFKTKYGKELLTLASPGGAGRNKTLGQSEFAKLKIRVPSGVEQKKIAEILKTWDVAIETVEKLIANAVSQKKDAMQKLLNAKIRLNSYTEQWKLTSLNELARIKMGSSPPSSAYNSDGNGLPLIQGNADIKNGKTHPRLFTSMVTQTCQIGDIIFSVRAPVGEVAISEHKACLGRGVAGICAKNAKHQDFIFQSLEFAEDNWMRISQGSTFQAIGGAELKNYKLMVPTNDEEFLEISKILKQMDNQINLLTKYKSTISKEKSALMQQLLTGKRRVKVSNEDMAA